MTSGHFITGLQLTFHRDEDLDHFQYARQKFVTALKLLDLFLKTGPEPVTIFLEFLMQQINLFHGLLIINHNLPPQTLGHFIQKLVGDLVTLDNLTWPLGNHIAQKQWPQAGINAAVQNGLLIFTVLAEPFDFFTFDGNGTFVLVDAVAVKDPNLNHRTGNPRRQTHGGITHIGSFFAKNGPQKFFFRGHRAFALGGNLAHQNITRMHLGTNIDDTGLIKVFQALFAHIGNIAGDVFGAKLGVPRHDLQFLDMDRGEDIVLHNPFGNQDTVFKVITVPRHEGHQHVTTQGQFAHIR